MTRRRVLIFSLAYEPFIGGAEVAIKEITNRLPDCDFEMVTVNLDGEQEREEKIGNVLVRRITGKYLYPFKALHLAAKLHRKDNYDVVWAIMANQAGMAAAAFKRKFPEVKFLLTLQEGDELKSLAYRLRLFGPRLWGVFKTADQIQVISNYLANWARSMGARCPIIIIPNGVDIKNFQLPDSSFKKRENGAMIITTSRLVWKNGVDTLIKALNYLPKEVKLQIVGDGPEELTLRQLMSRCHLDNRVEFLGSVKPDQIPMLLGGADVFVRASRSEGLGNSFLEAMAAGVPTVGTAVGGIPDFLFDPNNLDTECPNGHSVSQTGWLCRVNDPQSIADKVKFILDPVNAGKVEKIKENAKMLVEEKYNWEQIAQSIGATVDKLVG